MVVLYMFAACAWLRVEMVPVIDALYVAYMRSGPLIRP